MKNMYEARTLEQCKAEGYPSLRKDELRRWDRRMRDRQAMEKRGVGGGCIVQ